MIGITFGVGDGITTFQLPDYRGAFLRGSGNNGNSNHSGPSLNNPQTDSLGVHNHAARSTVTDPGHKHTQRSLNDDFNDSGYTNNPNPPNYGYPDFQKPSFAKSDSTGNMIWTNNIDPSGTGITVSTAVDTCGNTVETRPYNFGINWIIKYF